LSHDEISSRVGKSRVSITNTLRLQKLSDSVQKALVENKISEGHARALLALPTHPAQNAALQTILTKDLNVRQTEDLVRKLGGQKKDAPAVIEAPPPELLELEDQLRKRLGTRVNINQRKNGGAIVIQFYSTEELNAIIGALLGDN
jgi:ParB family chromosome partitioning protein